jgi:hypothetical protein
MRYIVPVEEHDWLAGPHGDQVWDEPAVHDLDAPASQAVSGIGAVRAGGSAAVVTSAAGERGHRCRQGCISIGVAT